MEDVDIVKRQTLQEMREFAPVNVSSAFLRREAKRASLESLLDRGPDARDQVLREEPKALVFFDSFVSSVSGLVQSRETRGLTLRLPFLIKEIKLREG